MSGGQPDVLVVGAGVCGLTTAICLAEAGLDVTIRAARPPLETTSVAAGAIWGPHLVEEGGSVARWGQDTLATLRELAGQPGTGVRMAHGIEAWRQPAELPGWSGQLTDVRRCEPAELPSGFVAGWRYSAPLVAMAIYLGYLTERFTHGGGRLELGQLGSLAEADAAVVVNCTGCGARDLVPDHEVLPVRGQVVLVANPGLTEFFIGPTEGTTDLVYMFPHGDTVLLGGSEQPGNWDLNPDPGLSRRILAGCAAIEPRLAGAGILAERVGLRPVRPRVRLESEPLGAGRLLVHNYGHGGAGVTLSWGCARDVADHILGIRG